MSHPRPDLTYPSLPDPQDLHPEAARPVTRGGTSLREDFEWPEAGPSSNRLDGALPDSQARGKGKERSMSPFGAKLIAAMTGATATSLLMTPFDVLKTRIQTVKPSPSYTQLGSKPLSSMSPALAEECCQTTMLTDIGRPGNVATNPLTCFTSVSSTTPLTASSTVTIEHLNASPTSMRLQAPSGCLYPSKWVGIWGETVTIEQGLSRGAASLTAARAVASNAGSTPLSAVIPGGFWNEIAAVRREAGVRGLWKGAGTTLTMGIPSAAIYMLGYEKLLSQISPYFTGSTDPSANTSSLNRATQPTSIGASLTPAPLLAGSIARTISATVISPIEMFRTRLQALPTIERGSPTYSSTAREMSHLVQSKGLTILWRGLGPTLWRDVPFSGIYWAGFEILKPQLSSPSSSFGPLSPIATSFFSGAISGTVSALVTQPFDVLKTRRQVFTPSPDCSPEALAHRASTWPLAVHVIKTEGWGALFAGVVPRCGKVAPACGLMIACYEGVGRWLGGREEPLVEEEAIPR